ncbi:MAG: DUF86 domain-containing protein [Chloroflexi bacterium]|nr:DUF86 domain-containing protein [Chloroflexota bacterium]
MAAFVHSIDDSAGIKAIEVIGEAASRISEGFRLEHTELPWREIIGMRHRLVHGYFEIDLDPLVPPEE